MALGLRRILRGADDSGPFSAAEAKAAMERGAREWPSWLISDSADSPFAYPSQPVWTDSPLCRGVRPTEGFPGDVAASPPIMHKDWTPEEVQEAYRGKRPMRAVVWAARAGMGNSIRGFVHTFLFALLSSRQLLLSTAGPWGTSIKALYEEFDGGPDRLVGDWVPRVPLYSYKKPVIDDMRPVVQGMPNLNREDWWYANESTRFCALSALRCQDVWCVRSRITQLMLGQAKNELGEAIQESLVVSPMLTSHELLQRHHHSIRILSDFIPWTAAAGRRISEGLSSLLTAVGAKGRPEVSEPGSHPALKIKFDVAIHIRTVHACVEKGSEWHANCKSHDVKDAFQALKAFPELMQYMTVHKWACVSNLLAHFLKLKVELAARLADPNTHLNLAQVPDFGEHLSSFLEVAAHLPGERPKSALPLSTETWTHEDAKAVAAEALGLSPEAAQKGASPLDVHPEKGLSIFLATDSEALRPLFVEFLRPFGTVAYSSAGVVHLSFSKGEERVESKSGTLSEFYLLSRAANIVAFDVRNSTYAEMAALYGNNTLIRGAGPHTCNFLPEHVGVPIR